MNRFEAGLKTAESPALRALDFSMFDIDDIVNIALQRTEVMLDINGHADAVRAWLRGDDAPMRHIAESYCYELVTRALAFVFMEYHDLRPVLRHMAPTKIADIGAGYGFFALFAHAELGAEMVLIDTETTPQRSFKFDETSTGVSNLAVARRFLRANGCNMDKILTLNPQVADVTRIRDVDLAVSFLSCGFQFPCDDYRAFFEHSVRPGGSVMLDIRTRQAHEILPGLAGLGSLRRIGHAADGKAIRMQLIKRRAAPPKAA